MIAVKVLKRFWDRKEKVTRWPDEVFVTTDARAMELQARLPDYVDLAVTQDDASDSVESVADMPEVADVPVSEDVAGVPDYSKMSNQELKDLCVERGIDVPKRAKKTQLIALLEG